jgi:hypothetical protein
MIRKYALGAACALFVSFTAGVSTASAAANPLGIAFKSTTNSGLYAKPTGMLITGRCNPYATAFADARRKGAEVLMYLNPMERPNKASCPLDAKFYLNDINDVPLWPYPSYGVRFKYPNSLMTDMRAGSKWILHVVSYVERIMREGKHDGIFLDSIGARPWGALSNYGNWSTTEKNAWTAGNVDLVRRLDAKRRAINPNFLIINNNVWDRGDGNTLGLAGEKYVDGIMLEHPRVGSAWHISYVAKAFGNLGQRRVLVIANTAAEARTWASRKGVTHVSGQTTAQYTYPLTPPVSFSYLGDRN